MYTMDAKAKVISVAFTLGGNILAIALHFRLNNINVSQTGMKAAVR